MNLLRYKRKSQKNIIKKRFILIVLFFIMSVFAWLAYIKNLSGDLKLHINTWNVKYYSGDGDTKTEISVRPYNMTYDTIYPGMLNQINKITVENNGEVEIALEYIFDNLKILNQSYEIVENASDATTEYYAIKQEKVTSGNYISQKLITTSEDIPFELEVVFPEKINSRSSSLITITLKWEGTNDVLDTKWGNDISNFIIENGDDNACINFDLNIKAYQVVTDESEETNNVNMISNIT